MVDYKILKGELSSIPEMAIPYLKDGYVVQGDLFWTGGTCECGCGNREYAQVITKYEINRGIAMEIPDTDFKLTKQEMQHIAKEVIEIIQVRLNNNEIQLLLKD